MIIIAAALYLPEHIVTIARRASFYWGGEESATIVHEVATTTAKTWGDNTPSGDADRVMDKMGEL